ncbi:hephaestin-like protein [Haliotis rufescens]|uniref:hephaestin-like protein n=1 Tax=Haliotis rufescens TaxID=6454 RepID=UPI00201F50C2|nr:hephaestin-like protein [Haliotis rufescens]
MWVVLVLYSLFHLSYGHPIHTSKTIGRTRVINIAAVDIDWDYAPLGNLVNDDPVANNFIQQGPNRIGSKYKKVVYREYTDNSFLYQAPRPAWLGYLGPVFRAEVGDTILIRFANLAFRCNQSFTLHSHGIFYLKNAEGAGYEDNTSGSDKLDDAVAPGQVYVYEWVVRETFAPTAEDENCLPWAYHSHRVSTRDVDTGLVGMFLTCKRGTLDSSGKRRDVDKEFIIYQDVVEEQNSWCIRSSLNNCLNVTECTRLLDNEDAAFAASNTMAHMNGCMYGNLPGLVVNVGEKVVWHFFSLNAGLQSAHINGQVLLVQNHRMNTITFYPATFRSALMIPENPGVWLFASRISTWYRNGMQAYVLIKPRQKGGYGSLSPYYSASDFLSRDHLPGLSIHDGHSGSFLPYHDDIRPVKRYFIAAEKVVWDYGPSGQDLYFGGSLTNPNSTASTYFTRGNSTIGGQYVKALYIEYTDATFTQKKFRTPDKIHLGLLGPVIKAEVGETVEIVFLNRADRNYSVYVHGVTFPKEQEGFVTKDPYSNGTVGKFARPGETVVYRFEVTDSVAPTEDDPPCLTYTYHSAVDVVKDVYTGLIGPVVICRKGHSFDWKSEGGPGHWSSTGSPTDREFFLLILTLNENESWYIDENIQRFALNPSIVDKTNSGFILSNTMFSINGRTFANLQGLDMCVGDHVTWHLFGLGAFRDNHGVNFNGQTLEVDGNHVEGKVIIPGSGVTLHSIPDSVGRWSVHCRTNFHFTNGMVALYDVFSCGAHHSKQWGHQRRHVRRYYIAAVEVVWDYAPVLVDLVTGLPLTNTSLDGYKFIKGGPNFIGSKYKKALYRQYTDSTFTTQIPRGPETEHLGTLGPFIRAEVGDIVEVVFRNLATRAYSITPEGLFYNKANEGAQYQDGSTFTGDNAVPPGQTYVYHWEVPKRSGPGKNDPNCISWLYHSSVDSTKDINSGLVGPLVICRRGQLNAYGKRTDKINREFALLFVIFNENDSHYLQENAATFAPNRTNVGDADFRDSNQMHSINGLIYGNVRGLTMKEGESVAWHILGLGSSADIHPVHFHGQTFIHRTDKAHRNDVIEVFPSTTETVEMFTDNPGTWLVHCHLGDHVKFGMEAVYTIKPKNSIVGPHHLNHYLFRQNHY